MMILLFITIRLLLLGRVVAVYRAKSAYSHWASVGLSACLSVCLFSTLWQNGWSDIDAVWDGRLDGYRDEADIWVWGSVHGRG